MKRTTMEPREKLYALVRYDCGGEQIELAYILAPSVKELWAAAIELEWFGTGYTVASLQRLGWRAKRVRVRVYARPKDFDLDTRV